MNGISNTTIAAQRPASARRRSGGLPGRGQGGFTLIELTVVILIILLLVGILLPAVARIRIQARVNASLSDIAILEQGIELWRDDYDEYPPSGTGTGNNGGQRLVYHLAGGTKTYGCEYVPTVNQGGRQSFADRFTHPYLYYRFERAEAKYVNDHNPIDPDNRTGVADANEYAKMADGRYYRSDFILMSHGPDGQFADPEDHPETDDITNLSQ